MDQTTSSTRTGGVIIGITGASGAQLGVRLLVALRTLDIETHLIITPPAEITLKHETSWTADDLRSIATHTYRSDDLAAPIASGSYPTAGMIIAPCSMKTLSAIANSYADTLVSRSADVTLKEGRRLILVVRESPLHLGHLRLMVQAAEIGAVIFPPVPALYTQPATVEAMLDEMVGRILMRFGLKNDLYTPWQGA